MCMKTEEGDISETRLLRELELCVEAQGILILRGEGGIIAESVCQPLHVPPAYI